MGFNFKPLIAEKGDDGEYSKVSIGRVSFWIVFGSALWMWLTGTATPDIPASMAQLLYVLLSYNLFKKGMDIWRYKIQRDGMSSEATVSVQDDAPRI